METYTYIGSPDNKWGDIPICNLSLMCNSFRNDYGHQLVLQHVLPGSMFRDQLINTIKVNVNCINSRSGKVTKNT